MSNYNSVIFDGIPDLNEDAARDCPISHNFGSSLLAIQSVKVTLAECGLNSLKMVYIDNSASGAPTSLIIGGTRQVITAAPYTQGYYRVLAGPLDLDYTITNYLDLTASTTVNLHWLNYKPCDPCIWSTQTPSALQGTPLAGISSGSNVTLNVAMQAANVVGRQQFVTSVSASGGGATTEASLNAQLTNILSHGSSVTLKYNIYIPSDPLGNVNFIQNFNPPIAVVMGQYAIWSVPAAGAGNLSMNASIVGFAI